MNRLSLAVLIGCLSGTALASEAPYAFRERLEVVHEPDRRDMALKPAADEFAFVDGAAVGDADFADYLKVSMSVAATAKDGGAVRTSIDAALPSRSYEISVDASGVSVRAADERALHQAYYHLEDLMNLRRAPFLKFGTERRRMRFSPRMIHSGYACDIFPDNYLKLIAHHGFDAIVFYIKDVDKTAAGTNQNVNGLIERARRVGLDTYLYSSVSCFAHPDDPEGAKDIEASFGRVAKAHPGAKGIVFVGESCQFPSKDPRVQPVRHQDIDLKDPRPLAGWFPCRDYPDWLTAVMNVLHRHSPKMEIVFWTYNWSRSDARDCAELIPHFPDGVAIQGTLGNGAVTKHDNGLVCHCRDYTVSTPGFTDHYAAQAKAAKASNRRFYTMANTAGLTWDYGTAPYLPCPYQWKKRWDGLVDPQYGIAGLMETHHFGWYPSFISELAKEAFTEGGMDFDTHIRLIAARDFGESNADRVVDAWKRWSRTEVDYVANNENQYGPFRLGPAFPYNFGGKKILHSEFPQTKKAYHTMRWMAILNFPFDLDQAHEQNIAYVELNDEYRRKQLELFGRMRADFADGVESIRAAAATLSGARRKKAEEMAGVGEWHQLAVETAINLNLGYLVYKAGDTNGVLTYARAEYKNTLRALKLAEEDSRLGYEPSMEYAAGPEQLVWKLRRMESLYGKENLAPVPQPPPPSAWTFRRELSEPVVYHAPRSYDAFDRYGLKGALETVRDDLDRYFASAPSPATAKLVLTRGKVAGRESYRVNVLDNGDAELVAEDDEGIRRAAYYFEDRVSAGDLRPTVRKPWLENRISRCFFGPIKRHPYFRDELMDDVDYYPEAYLNRLAHEGINGLWLTVEWRDLAETSVTRRAKDAPRRLAKLRRTVEKCLKYGIKTWMFCIEPHRWNADDPFCAAHPEMFSPEAHNLRLMCPSSPEARRYVEESVKDIFTQVPGLGGVMMISHGERPTTCFSGVNAVTGERLNWATCPRCADKAPWQMHNAIAEAIVRGMRAAGSDGQYISWLYQPYVFPERADWSAEIARHLPDGVVLAYNFESGAIKEQLGRLRNGGDYWLSYVGPANGFRAVAESGKQVRAKIGAKIQVGNSHEVATVPFVPVPGLLYRKYKSMREMGVSTALQCWYFGNYPGVMNKAAGELAFETFEDDEAAFLKRLAAPDWRDDAEKMADVWKRFSDAYAEYPLSNDMQYYGPFHAGPAWPLSADVCMKPLGRTWKPQDAPSGDAIGDALENHTLEEASILAHRMAGGVKVVDVRGRDVLDVLAGKWKGDKDRMRDLGVIRALGLQFESGANIFDFYRNRKVAIYESRMRHDAAAADCALARMEEAVGKEELVTKTLLPLTEDDSRLGFHSEAEAHQYHPAKLRWRLGELACTRARIFGIRRAIAEGGEYPESDFERMQAGCTVGDGNWVQLTGYGRFKCRDEANGDMSFEVEIDSAKHSFVFRTLDAAGTLWSRQFTVNGTGPAAEALPMYNCISPSHEITNLSFEPLPNGGRRIRLTLDSSAWGGTAMNRPAWLAVMGVVPEQFDRIWPAGGAPCESRLNIGSVSPNQFGRLRRLETQTR